MGRKSRIVLIVAALAAALGIAAWLGHGHWTPSRSAYSVQGIDVSHHQGRIDWTKLRAQGVDFAYIKATEGGDHRDRRLAENWAAAKASGISRGAYHFFTLCRSGADQAANFVATVPRDPDALPPAVDLEFLGNCRGSRGFDRAALHRELGVFLRIVEAHSGKRAILYLTEEFDDAFAVSFGFDRPLWLRNIILEPRFGSRPWTLWQASNFRRLDGIQGRVDWNAADLTKGGLPPLSQP